MPQREAEPKQGKQDRGRQGDEKPKYVKERGSSQEGRNNKYIKTENRKSKDAEPRERKGKGTESLERQERKAKGTESLERRERKGKGTESLERREQKGKGTESRERKGKDTRSRERQGQRGKGTGPREQKGKAAGTKALCPVAAKCGGCQWIDKSYEEQLQAKSVRFRKLMEPYCRPEAIIGMENPANYRNKVHAAFGEDRRHNAISGIYEERSHRIVPVDSCLIENQKADEIIVSVRGLLKSFKIRPYSEDTGFGLLRHVLIRVGHATGEIMVVLVLSSPIMPSKNHFVEALLKLHPEITTIVVNVNDRDTSMILGERQQVIYGKGYIEDRLCGMVFRISPKSFYQVNPVQTEKLYRLAVEYARVGGEYRAYGRERNCLAAGNEEAGGEYRAYRKEGNQKESEEELKSRESFGKSPVVWDLYCGIGTISLFLAKEGCQVCGVEVVPQAVEDARNNAAINGIENVEFFEGKAEEVLPKYYEQYEKNHGGEKAHADVIVVDPPRKGCEEALLKTMVDMEPERIVYVSCDSATLARDVKYLRERGYEVVRGRAVDQFPHTVHVETCVLLGRK